MVGRGPKGLEALDLSENPDLTSDCLRYLKCYPRLRLLNLSNTAITAANPKLKNLSMKVCGGGGGGGVDAASGGLASLFCVPTEGWASNVVGSWLSWYHNRSKRPRLGENSFYSRQRLKYRLSKSEVYTKPRYQLLLTK
ncbi:hypothetical protein Ahia01_000939900 [Argonauta hians]